MKYVVSKPMSLMDALQQLSPDSSKTTLRQWIKLGRILVDGKPLKKNTLNLLEGQTLSLASKTQKPVKGISIVYEDDHLIVINKPAGLLSVATDFELSRTAHAILKDHLNRRVYIVHRLDQETSGVMLFALSKEALQGLKVQFADHSILRRYVAVVEGRLEKSSGTWDTLLHEDELYHVHVSEGYGERAISHFEVQKVSKETSTLLVTLETGKKNQIRVHCQHAGHPVVGDEKYGSTINPLKRLGLHAETLAFTHPITQKRMTFQSPAPWRPI